MQPVIALQPVSNCGHRARITRARLATIALLAIGLLTGCGDRNAPRTSAPPVEGQPGLKVYRHSMDESPTSLDPAQTANIYASAVLVNTYDTLYQYKYLARPYQLEPNLAVAWPEISDDKLTYTIQIKQGVHFVDDPAFADGIGRELVAADIAYSIKRHFDPATRSQSAWKWQGRIAGLEEWKAAGANYDVEAEGIRATGRYTLQIKLIRPYPQLLDTLAQASAGVVPELKSSCCSVSSPPPNTPSAPKSTSLMENCVALGVQTSKLKWVISVASMVADVVSIPLKSRFVYFFTSSPATWTSA